MQEPLTPADVQAVLDQFNFGIHIRFFEQSTATSQMAADNIGCELGQIVKSLAFIADGKPILVLASGDQRVDEKKIADILGVSRKKVKTATAEECVTIYGYPPGSVPPFPHRTHGMPIYIDDSLQRFEQLYAAGGAHNAIFPITLGQLARVTGGVLANVRKE